MVLPAGAQPAGDDLPVVEGNQGDGEEGVLLGEGPAACVGARSGPAAALYWAYICNTLTQEGNLLDSWALTANYHWISRKVAHDAY